MKRFAIYVFAAILGGAVTLGGAKLLGFGKEVQIKTIPSNSFAQVASMPMAGTDANSSTPTFDFSYAAEKALPSVVHIQATMHVKDREMAGGFDLRGLPDPFRQFFGYPQGDDQDGPSNRQGDERIQQGSGSGVIISPDGYIVTNNHVVADADELSVTLNDHEIYDAEVIGTDPSTDVALIKIKANDLPAIDFFNSDQIKVGEWVVAVGNPFNLESTVTAGIVSAKARNINIMQDKTPIESFIQTDAAINPGNSGGALVNLQGQLVGINSAIASPTGAYAGYGFAIPSNIVRKVVSDLKEYGVVQRGFIGAMIRNIDGNLAKDKGLTSTVGVYVDSLTANSSAAEAGIKVGDVIIAADGVQTPTSPKLLEMIGRHRPGEQVDLTVRRKGEEKNIAVTLKNREGNTDVIKKEAPSEIMAKLGASFEPLSNQEAKQLDLDGGLKVTDITNGKLANQTDIQEGFIVTKVDGKEVSSVEDLTRILDHKKGGVLIEGRYPNSPETYYFGLGL
ncbi:MAG TPA: Do family serine endopeptidase [Saprospiraceae bacterium]|nr:Do family serine endopeptidase [Lewinellaceae bacterium]HPG09718.1 Do family serine endopeptidase [Saprospiraceae bacterium]HPQ99767.1 Do family serine endopeptidase [Saprospiraceae bacterium]HQU52556.1 Do family serine endopeptidase [Saprospiraceae bacterium]HRV87181.1 Do family serine endopeptidase [Saprospiraceae bacterium]